MQDFVNDFSCTCGYAYTGTLCDDIVDFCDPDLCQNGGTCNVSKLLTHSAIYIVSGCLIIRSFIILHIYRGSSVAIHVPASQAGLGTTAKLNMIRVDPLLVSTWPLAM